MVDPFISKCLPLHLRSEWYDSQRSALYNDDILVTARNEMTKSSHFLRTVPHALCDRTFICYRRIRFRKCRKYEIGVQSGLVISVAAQNGVFSNLLHFIIYCLIHDIN
jgi:hypothetical protein